MACEALLNQDIFAGFGNIIKTNYCIDRILLLHLLLKKPSIILYEIISESSIYGFEFLKW